MSRRGDLLYFGHMLDAAKGIQSRVVGRLANPEIAWIEIVGMRHRIVHNYTDINLNVVWKAATEHVPLLITALEKITPPEPPSA